MKIYILLLLTFTFSLTKAQVDVRNVQWGYTQTQVLAAEKSKLESQKKDTLKYRTTMNGSLFRLIYIFYEKSLKEILYEYLDEHGKAIRYLEEYNKLKEIITNKYGEPVSEKEIWKDEFYKNEPDKLSTALSLDHVYFTTVWRTDKTSILICCFSRNGQIDIGISYGWTAMLQYLKGEKDKKNKEDF